MQTELKWLQESISINIRMNLPLPEAAMFVAMLEAPNANNPLKKIQKEQNFVEMLY